MSKCTKCKQEKQPTEFNFKNKKLGIRQVQCKACTRLFIKNHYNNNKEYYLAKARKRNSEVRQKIIHYVNDYLSGHPCIDCRESDLVVLEFDHTGKVPKYKAVSSLIRNHAPLEIIQEEIDKCEVRCANCHRRKTAKNYKWLKLNPHSW